MACFFTKLSNSFNISLLIYTLGFSNANPVVLNVAKVQDLSTATASNSSGISIRQDGIPPGGCDWYLNEVLEFSECTCNNIMTAWCWTSDYGPKGSTKFYQAASYTADCVDSDRFGTMDVTAQEDYTCKDFDFTAYGGIRVVARVIGGCPSQDWPVYAIYTNASTGQNFGTVSIPYWTWLSPVFQATGNAVHFCVAYYSGPPLTIAIAFTPQITDSCEWRYSV